MDKIDFVQPANSQQMQIMLNSMEKSLGLATTFSVFTEIPTMKFPDHHHENNIPKSISAEIVMPKAKKMRGGNKSGNSVEKMQEVLIQMGLVSTNPEAMMLSSKSRKNEKISMDPQSARARRIRQRLSGKMSTLHSMIPGGESMDTATMLDQSICYVNFLKERIRTLELEFEESRSKMTVVEKWCDQHHSPSLSCDMDSENLAAGVDGITETQLMEWYN